MMQLAQELSTAVGKVQACEALRLPRSSFYRSTASNLVDDTRVDRRSSPRALSDTERKSVLRTLHCNRFVDKSPGDAVVQRNWARVGNVLIACLSIGYDGSLN